MTTKPILLSTLILSIAAHNVLATKEQEQKREFINGALWGDFEKVQNILNTSKHLTIADKNRAFRGAIESTYPASERNHEYIKVVEALIKDSPHLGIEESLFGETVAHLAAFRCNYEMLRILDKNNVDLTKKDIFGNSPLYYACNQKSKLESDVKDFSEEDFYHSYAQSVIPHCQITIKYLEAKENSQK